MNNILLVDGYNIIGAWPILRALKENHFAEARDILIQKMAEYQAYTGFRVIVVFDAHLVKGIEAKHKNYRVEVIYTKENETADERIEKMAIDLNNIQTQIHVATSDYTEQWAIFGQGALRKSARELLIEMETIEKSIKKRVSKIKNENPAPKIALSEDVLKTFEKWRRGDL
ncbi:ribosome-dependent mRNA decay endonuclease Rae1/YacP [Metabacillus sp. GX 13764]|uniref:ribosome-dependent mRNA decay endonuclease Rae1/YacP n=1 Tax=Metabacillus kandeliae TaxID=2900151 RepID=UPI001E3E927F|nr:ribosome-dependent mRNA decay endonuclease Rae1/YacP [Metabacillus kandeliae]MCD7036560.1 ribosome-dependent mRNA decay endonuclease Rae1/YacP [Metabacillus kandeliae]